MCIIDPSSIFACATLGCGVLSTAYLASNIDKIPHPSECGLIGLFYRMTNIHSHEPLELTIKLKHVTSSFIRSKYFIEVVSGRFKYPTEKFSPKNNEIHFDIDLSVHLRQCDDFITINLYRSHMLQNKLWATLKVTLDNILNIPKLRSYTMEGSHFTKIYFSIHRFGSNIVDQLESPLKMYALTELQNDGVKDVEEYMLEHLNGETPDNKHLRFYSFAVSGELEIINDLTVYYKEYYFRAIELTSGYWVWCYWKSREDFKNKKKEKGRIPMLSIALIDKNRIDNHEFFVRYTDKNGYKQEFLAKCINRSRDSWVACMNEFIQMARTVYFNSDRYQRLRNQLNIDPSAFKEDMGGSPRFRLIGEGSDSDDDDNEEEDPGIDSNELNDKMDENSEEDDHMYPHKSEDDSQYASMERNILENNIKLMESNFYRNF